MFNHSCFWLHRSVATNVLYPTPRAERQNSMASTNVKLVDRGAEGGNAFVRSVEQNARARRQNSMASTNVKLVDRGAEGGNAFVRSVEQNARAREVDRDHAGERPVARSKLDE